MSAATPRRAAATLALGLSLALAPCLAPAAGGAAQQPATLTRPAPAPAAEDPHAALAEGRRLLSAYRSDRAYTKLQAALREFTQRGNRLGVAAAKDALGDLYALQGQRATALGYYRDAQETFLRQNDLQNSNALLAKIGEQHLLAGETERGRAAFAAMSFARAPQDGAAGGVRVGAADEKSDDEEGRRPRGGVLASLASASACAMLPAAALAGAAGDAAEPPNMGSAPRTPNGLGRMDLRVTDEAGRPLEGVVGQIQSTRPNGLYCECWSTTSALGRAVMPALHIADQVKLVLKARDLPAQELTVSAKDLARPVRVVVSKAGASLLAATLAGTCLGFYRSFNLYAAGELGLARADLAGGRPGAARARYEALLKQLALPGLENFKQTPRFRAAALTSLGDIALGEGRHAEAATLYAGAAKGAREANRLDLAWAAQRGLGRALWRQAAAEPNAGRARRLRAEAADAYRAALKSIETIRAGSLRADESRTTFLATTRDVYEEASALLVNMALDAGARDAGQPGQATPAALRGQSLALASEAFAVTEQGRARSLLDMLSEAQAGITEGVPADLLRRRGEVAARQQEIAESLMGVTLQPDGQPPAEVSELEAELERLAVEYDGLENTIRTSSPRYAALTGARPLTLAEVQQRVLDAGTALALYSLGADESFLWLVTPTEVSITRLPARAEVEARAMKLRAQLIPAGSRRAIVGIDVAASGETTRGLTHGADTTQPAAPAATDAAPAAPPASSAPAAASYASAAHALYQTVLEPVAPRLAGKRLLVVADGALNYVPFEALVTAAPPAGGAVEYSSLPYLVRTNEVVYAPSASVIDAVRRQSAEARKGAAQAGGAAPVLVVADPVFSRADARVRKAADAGVEEEESGDAAARGLTMLSSIEDVTGEKASAADKLNIRRLTGTRAEADDINAIARAASASADLWLDLDASEANVATRDLTAYGVVHFATHGLLDAERPQFTGLVLSLVGGGERDGFLRTGEVFNLRLGRPLVMLSACETGLGRERRGEGVIGLTRAFMYAGAPTVGVSLWAVADRSTAVLMSDFYKGYFAGGAARPAGAMRAAQLDMLADARYSAPYYWAPFVLVGDWL